MDRDGLLAPVGLRHGGDADEFAHLDVVERCLDQRHHPRRVDELHLDHVSVARFDVENITLDFLDLTTDAHRRRLLLGKARGRGEQQGEARHGKNATCDLVHVVLPKVFSPAKRHTTV